MGPCSHLPEPSQNNKECGTILSERAYRKCIYSLGISVLVLERKVQGFCGFQHGILENDNCDVTGHCGSVRIWNFVY